VEEQQSARIREGTAPLAAAAWTLVAVLPLAGLVSLLLRSQLDRHWANHRLHFVLFLAIGVMDLVLAGAAGDAARRRGDARVLLIASAFLATGGFLALHALGTPGVLFTRDLTGFKVAIPVGLCVAAVLAAASAFTEDRPRLAAAAVRHQRGLQAAVLATVVAWSAWTVAEVPPLDRPGTEGSTGPVLTALAAGSVVLYGVAALRYLALLRVRPGLLPAAILACFVLLAEAMVGVTVTGERAWHASWWEWHALIVTSFLLVGFAAQREWRDERFRSLYLPATRGRSEEVSVVSCALGGFADFCERTAAGEVAELLRACYGLAAPVVSARGGEIEHFGGEGMMAIFLGPGHPVRAANAALELQDAMLPLSEAHPGWPRLHVGVNTGPATVREMGGHGRVAYTVNGDSVNVGARLGTNAPAGGVLIGAETYRRLPGGARAAAVPGLAVKGRTVAVDAFLLQSLPGAEAPLSRRFMRSRR
jgi:class 3 adenylate cyclase